TRATFDLRRGTTDEWAALGDGARAVYGGTPAPGDAIASPEAHNPTPDQSRFTIITARVDEIETLQLGQDRHRRAVFCRGDGFQGKWLAP
ncbi:MAG: hypothetical protein AAGJ74_14605, partial [Pseudomonadota bacterium]